MRWPGLSWLGWVWFLVQAKPRTVGVPWFLQQQTRIDEKSNHLRCENKSCTFHSGVFSLSLFHTKRCEITKWCFGMSMNWLCFRLLVPERVAGLTFAPLDTIDLHGMAFLHLFLRKDRNHANCFCTVRKAQALLVCGQETFVCRNQARFASTHL